MLIQLNITPKSGGYCFLPTTSSLTKPGIYRFPLLLGADFCSDSLTDSMNPATSTCKTDQNWWLMADYSEIISHSKIAMFTWVKGNFVVQFSVDHGDNVLPKEMHGIWGVTYEFGIGYPSDIRLKPSTARVPQYFEHTILCATLRSAVPHFVF